MTDHVRTKPGLPDSGQYYVGDRLTDSRGVRYLCIAQGSPGEWITDPNPDEPAAPTASPVAGRAIPRVADLPPAARAYLGQLYLKEGEPDSLHVCKQATPYRPEEPMIPGDPLADPVVPDTPAVPAADATYHWTQVLTSDMPF